jgi:hypothetical protein
MPFRVIKQEKNKQNKIILKVTSTFNEVTFCFSGYAKQLNEPQNPVHLYHKID